MAFTEWMIRGPEIASCNCAYGCPCQFNSLPTDGTCRAAVGMQIEKGHYGKVKLDGLRWAATAAWPGPIHMGHGEIQPIVDERATPEQREALLKIMSGQDTEPGATFFNVFVSMCDKVHEPMFKPIEFAVRHEELRGPPPRAGRTRREDRGDPQSGNRQRASCHAFRCARDLNSARRNSPAAQSSPRARLRLIPMAVTRTWPMLHLTGQGMVH